MSSDLLSIARSGAMAARIALDVTAQNIANASSAGYVRRSVSLAEVTSSGGFGRSNDVSLSGVRLDRVVRNVDQFRQAEVRRTGSDAARAGAELNALENIETAVEQSGLYPAIIGFDTALQRLSTDPIDPSLRSAALEAARTLAGTFNLAASGLEASSTLQRFEAQDEVNQVNDIASELGLVNLRLSRAGIDSSDQAALLDQRDLLLDRLSGFSDITTEIAPDQSVSVRLGGSTGPQLVSGGTTQPLAMSTAGDGTISFTLGGGPVALSGGALAGRASALSTAAATRTTLDGLANSLISTANAAQASGAALDGTAGQPLFSGSGAGGISLALTSGAGLATAPAGSAAGSRDQSNLATLRGALSGADLAGGADALLFSISSTVASRRTTSEALDVIAGSARVALSAQAGVDLDAEAVNLIRFQQAFQANGKAMQVAATLFDTLLAIR